MKDRFNSLGNPLPIHLYSTEGFSVNKKAEDAFYFLANLEFADFTEDEVRDIFSTPKDLAYYVGNMLNECNGEEDADYMEAVNAVSCVLLYYFSRSENKD